ncbi:MAG: hypothetical protein IJM51_10140 [Clostridia bacterium]|nr:hypothetical protein [Clostridia bacterium]
MKIRRSMVVLFIIASLVIPISLYRNIFSENASEEFVSTVGIISNVLMTVFLMLVVAFSIFSDDFPHSYAARKSGGLGLVSMLAAGACGFSSILGMISDNSPMYSGTGGIVFLLLGLLTVLAMMFYSVGFFKGENLILSFPVVPILPALWYGYRMLTAFLRSASMADISAELPVIAMCCSFTIFFLTIGKLFCCINSNSIKWGFAAGCIGIMTSLLYSVNWLVKDCKSTEDLLSNPLVFTDIFMALFAIGSLFHVSNPAEYFDDEEWDDYFYETYDLPKPNLILHTPVEELEENSLLDSDINESPYIPVNTSIGTGRRDPQSSYPPQAGEPRQQQPPRNAVPSYIANPAAYYGQYAQPVQQQPYYPPAYPSYPVYPYQGVVPPNAGYGAGYPAQPQPVEYVNPYDAAAAQYQYERRRSELQSRELEKLTGEVDNSIARLQSNVTRSQPPSNQYVNAAPDERLKDRPSPAQSNTRNVRLAQGYSQSGERLTDHVDRLEQQNRRVPTQTADDDDEYTYEYYYPTDISRYSPNQFNPTDSGRGNQSGRR